MSSQLPYELPLSDPIIEPIEDISEQEFLPPEIEKEQDLPDGSSVFVVGKDAEEEKSSSADSDFYRNLAEDLDSNTLSGLASKLLDDIKDDRDSRRGWESTVKLALKYLGFKIDEFRNVPFFRACAAYDTTLAITLMNFYALARAELFPPAGPAKCEIEGIPTPETEDEAERVEMFINYFLTKIDKSYYSDSDRLILYVGLFGCAFRKVVMDPILKRPAPRLVKPQNLIINNSTTSLLDSTRIAEEIFLTRKEILLRQRDGIYLSESLPINNEENGQEEIVNKQIKQMEGVSDSQEEKSSLFKFFEVHVELDPRDVEDEFEHEDREDEEESIPRPYIVEICEATKKICSIRRNWKPEDANYSRIECYVHYYYLPGFGIYSIGLAHMIGSNAIVLTDIQRQLIDAGTLKNFPGGLRQAGMRIENNDKAIGPSEFLEIETGGAPIQDAIMLMPYNEPSTVLAQLRSDLAQQSQNLAGASQQGVGDLGSNTPVGTILAQLEVQNRIPSTILKSLRTSLSYELMILKGLFGQYFSDEPYPFNVKGNQIDIMKSDFNDNVNVIPVSDANVITSTHRVVVAEILLKLAQSAPDIHNMHEAFKRMYEAMNIYDIDKILPPPEDVKALDPITENTNILMGKPVKASIEQDQDSHILVHSQLQTNPALQQDQAKSGILAAHIAEHQALKYLVEMQMMLGITMPEGEMAQDVQVQNQIALMAAEALKQKQEAEAQQNPPPPDASQVMMADIEQRREAALLKHEEAQLRAETEAFKAQSRFEIDKAKLEGDKEMAQDKNELTLELAQLKQPSKDLE